MRNNSSAWKENVADISKTSKVRAKRETDINGQCHSPQEPVTRLLHPTDPLSTQV